MEQTAQTTQPATPAQEHAQMVIDRAAGKIDDYSWRNGMQQRFEQLAQQSAAGPAPSSLSQQQAQSQLDTLRARRIAGEVGEREYFAQMEQLGPLAAGEQPMAPQPQLTIEQQLRAGIDKQMAGAKPYEYQFESSPGHQMDDDALAWDTEVRSAFTAMGIPKHLGGPIHEAVNRVFGELGRASPEQKTARISQTTEVLRQRWGAEFEQRRDAVDDLIYQATEKHPAVAQAIYSAPWLLADVAVWHWLDTVAQHRAGNLS